MEKVNIFSYMYIRKVASPYVQLLRNRTVIDNFVDLENLTIFPMQKKTEKRLLIMSIQKTLMYKIKPFFNYLLIYKSKIIAVSSFVNPSLE